MRRRKHLLGLPIACTVLYILAVSIEVTAFSLRCTISSRYLLPTYSRQKALKKDNEILDLEKQVLASAQAKMDTQRLIDALDKERQEMKSDLVPDSERLPTSPWKVAFAAASVASALSFVIFQNVYVAAFVLGTVFIVSSRDPLEEDDNLAGALVRGVGRATLKSVEASQPKIRALARAVITGEEEIVALKQRLNQVEQERNELELWKRRRLKVDEALSKFTVEELKEQARQHGLMLGGPKAELLMRLVEAEAIEL